MDFNSFITSKFNSFEAFSDVVYDNPFHNIAKKYQALAALKSLQCACEANKHLDLTQFEHIKIWEDVLNSSETYESLSISDKASFLSKLAKKIENLANSVFDLHKSEYTESFLKEMKEFPADNIQDMDGLTWILEKITQNMPITAMKDFDERHKPNIKKAVESLLTSYHDNTMFVVPELFALFQKSVREIAQKKLLELDSCTNICKFIKDSSDSRSRSSSKMEISKKQITNHPQPTDKEISANFPGINLPNLKLIIKYLDERGVTFSEFIKIDKELSYLFIQEFGAASVVSEEIHSSGLVGDLIGKGIFVEQIFLQDKRKAKMILYNIEKVIILCGHPINMPYALMTELSLEKMELIIRNAQKLLKLKKQLKNIQFPTKFLLAMPISSLKQIFSKSSNAYIENEKVSDIDVTNEKKFALIYKFEERGYFNEFRILSDKNKEDILNSKNQTFINHLVDLNIPLAVIIELFKKEYSTVKINFENYAPFIIKAISLKISPKIICQNFKNMCDKNNKENYPLYCEPTTLENLMKYCRGNPDIQFQTLIHLIESTKYFDLFWKVAQNFDPKKLNLTQLIRIPSEIYSKINEFAVKHPNLLKNLSIDNLHILIKHISVIDLFLDNGMAEEALWNLNAQTWESLVLRYASITSDLNKKKNLDTIIQNYAPKSRKRKLT